MTQLFFRAKAFTTLGLPGRPKVMVDVIYGPWKDRKPPAAILAIFLGRQYPALTPVVQQCAVTRA